MANRFIEFERATLYEQIWQKPISRIAEEYGVGRTEVKRAAEALAIPLPPNGHWTKVEHGKGIPTPPLPTFEGETTYRHAYWVNEETEEVERRYVASQEAATPAASALPALSATIAECLPIVKKMAARLKKGYKDGRNWPVVSGFQGLFELSVAPSNQERALFTFDRVLRHCLAAGLKITADESSREPAFFLIDGTPLTIRIFESARREERELTAEERARLKANPNAYLYRPDRYAYFPTNVLKLEVRHKEHRSTEFTIVDAAQLALAERIESVPLRMKEVALKDKLRRELREEERRQYEERRQAHQKLVAIKREELDRLKHYEELADQLQRAHRLRELADGMERSGGFSHEEGVEKVTWIRNAADWLDPLVGKAWPVVDDVSDHYY